MNNGCLCCSVRDTGLLAILALMEKKGRFDQIVLETTGLADPGPIIQAFWNEPALQIGAFSFSSVLELREDASSLSSLADVALDAVVGVVDAAGIEKVCLLSLSGARTSRLPFSTTATARSPTRRILQ